MSKAAAMRAWKRTQSKQMFTTATEGLVFREFEFSKR
jgi:hypothetical protein